MRWIACLIGCLVSGAAAAATLHAPPHRAVLGFAPTAKAAAVLREETGIISDTVAKLLYEAIEEIDRAPVEAVAATGASRAQVVAYRIVPQVMPAFAGISVFRWDINIRESTVLGLVGAGRIGDDDSRRGCGAADDDAA